MDGIEWERFQQLRKQWGAKSVAVIGDVMLDHYYWGVVNRLSPEAPVPIVDLQEESFHLGGASNVANNLACLGLHPVIFGVVGNDEAGRTLRELLEQNGMESAGIIVDEQRPTTVKTRIIGNNQHIARLDRENRAVLPPQLTAQLVGLIESFASQLDAVIFQDYDKGVITPQLIETVKQIAHRFDLPIFVDPKYRNFFHYTNVTFFKPNKKETQDALHLPLQTFEDVEKAGNQLRHRLNADLVLITLGADGMVLFDSSDTATHISTRARHVADVSGAGDTVIATFVAAFLGGATPGEAAALSNIAAGAVCEEPGIIPITMAMLERAIQQAEELYDSST